MKINFIKKLSDYICSNQDIVPVSIDYIKEKSNIPKTRPKKRKKKPQIKKKQLNTNITKIVDPEHIETPEYISLRRLTLKEYLIEMTLFSKDVSRRKKNWITLIENNNLICPVTGKKVSYCSYDMALTGNTFHYNFYSKDGELMNIDHKIPISRGGSKTSHKNIQPMVFRYNCAKGNNMLYL